MTASQADPDHRHRLGVGVNWSPWRPCRACTMKKPLVAVGLIVLLHSCRTDSPVEPPPVISPSEALLRIHVVPEWNNQPFQDFTEYLAPGGYRFQVELLRFYLSEIKLVNDAGEQMISTVKLLDMGSGGLNIDIVVPEGSWYGLRAGLGLPHDLNYTNAALYGDGHPMSVNTGMYWSWATGYKFVLFDGRYNPDPLSTGALLSPFSVHTGMDTCYTTVDLFPAVPFSTVKDSMTEVTLRVAVDGFLQTPEETINVTIENQSHGSNYPLALKLTRNVKRSLRLE